MKSARIAWPVIAMLLFIGLGTPAPATTSARALPATTIACGHAALLDHIAYTPSGAHQVYSVSFDVQGVGIALTQVTPWYSYVWTDVNSPGSVTHYAYTVEADRYPGRPTEIQIEGDAAPCSQYPDGMVFTNVQIAPLAIKSNRQPSN